MSEEFRVEGHTIITSYKPFWKKVLDLFKLEPVYTFLTFDDPVTLKYKSENLVIPDGDKIASDIRKD